MTDTAERKGAVVLLAQLIAHELALSEIETISLLGLQYPSDLAGLADKPSSAVPNEMLERLTILLDIKQKLAALLSPPETPAGWLRTGSFGEPFSTPMEIMLSGLQGMRALRVYLRAVISRR